MKDDVITALNALSDLQGRLTPVQLFHLHWALEGAVRDAIYPALELVTGLVDDEQVRRQLTCPHCGLIVASDAEDDDVELEIQDVATRATRPDRADFDAPEITVWYDSDRYEWEGLVTVCAHCATPVSLPEHWVERTA